MLCIINITKVNAFCQLVMERFDETVRILIAPYLWELCETPQIQIGREEFI